MSVFHLGPITEVEILPSPILFRVRTGKLFLRALEDGEVQSHSEFATFTIDEATGSFSCQSEYGDYAYTWPPHARRSDIFTFLASLGFDYFMGKAAKQAWQLFDLERTIEAARNEIRQERRGSRQTTDLSKQLANEMWEALDDIEAEHPTTDNEFYRLWNDHSCLGEWFVDYGPSVYTKVSPLALTFWDVVWQALIKSPQYRAHMRAPARFAA
jgi:hypothetical protein